MEAVAELAANLNLPRSLVERHVMQPLARPLKARRFRWIPHIPPVYRKLLDISDGVDFFGRESWDGFRLWGSRDFDRDIMKEGYELGIYPIFGRVPHLTPILVADESIVKTDWEVLGDAESGWLKPIASSISEYVRTVIRVRDAYGYEPDGTPADWCDPYASQGFRYDLEPD